MKTFDDYKDRLTDEQKNYYDWITKAEQIYNSAKIDQDKAREYYESKQAPDFVPKGITYVERNLITDMINGLVGQLIGGDIDIELFGAGQMADGLIELVYDIFERNRFNQRVKETWANYFYVEGKESIEFYFNPRKKSIYGMGIPELIVRRPREIWFDPNSQGGMHEDDKIRIVPVRILVSEAQKRWPKFANEIYETSDMTHGRGTHAYCDLYQIEYKTTEFKTDEDGNKYEEDVFYKVKVINKLITVMKAKKTGYRRFTYTIGIHTPREGKSTKGEPIGAVFPVKQSQDIINATGSAAYEALKHDIKNLWVGKLLTPVEQSDAKKQIARQTGFVNISNPQGDLEQKNKQGLSPAMLQMHEYERTAFDEISGRYAPERGVTEQDLSGKAIGLLHNRGKIPELTKKLHLEYQLTEIVMLMLECASKKMADMPFNIQREVQGKKKTIYYNTPAKDVTNFEPDEYNNLDEETGLINNLLKVDVDKIDLSINLKMNALEEDAYEAQKALLAYQNQLLPPKIAIKKLYPRRGDEYYEEMVKYSEAMKIVEMLSQNPELGKVITQGIGQVQQLLQMQEMQKDEQRNNPTAPQGNNGRMEPAMGQGV